MRFAWLLGVAVVIAPPLPPSSGQTRTITLPRETAAYISSDLPGYPLVQRNCVGCHSAHYVAMQPPSSLRAYWEATVKKMKKPFGAVFPDEDIAAMVDYLVNTYGSERAIAPASRGDAAPRPHPSKR